MSFSFLVNSDFFIVLRIGILNINFFLILLKISDIIDKQSGNSKFFYQIYKIIDIVRYYDNFPKNFILYKLHNEIYLSIGGAILVKIHIDNADYGDIRIKKRRFRFLVNILKFDLVGFVGIKS